MEIALACSILPLLLSAEMVHSYDGAAVHSLMQCLFNLRAVLFESYFMDLLHICNDSMFCKLISCAAATFVRAYSFL